MRMYKFMIGSGHVKYTQDKILADFMNKRLTWFQRIVLWFK
jgi:hypothetical protein